MSESEARAKQHEREVVAEQARLEASRKVHAAKAAHIEATMKSTPRKVVRQKPDVV
jgi:hypothetical protein